MSKVAQMNPLMRLDVLMIFQSTNTNLQSGSNC